ncbi:MAG: hypothetical protein JXQ71_00555 [Verrucomicrobia bacterium]|nr:hypothetical protein [Verrucomicrobiota bacterium]
MSRHATSLHIHMVQAARQAPRVLGEATEQIAAFVRSQQHPSGGFVDRNGSPDLYYTVFALDSLMALQQQPALAPLAAYLRSFGDGTGLDLVHLCSLARGWAALRHLDLSGATSPPQHILPNLERFRASDGGFHPKPGNRTGTAYGAFLALGAHQDAGCPLPDPESLAASLEPLATPDGAWTNECVLPPDSRAVSKCPQAGATNATAAAVLVLRHLARPIPATVGDWLLRQWCPQGGFRASPATPMPDLLSTATALHALAALDTPIAGLREVCLDFLDSLWTNAGSFHGHWADDHLDCEYTFYGLLAAGHLAP